MVPQDQSENDDVLFHVRDLRWQQIYRQARQQPSYFGTKLLQRKNFILKKERLKA